VTTSYRWRVATSGASVCIALAAVGCTGSDVLETDNNVVRIEIATAGQTQQTYDCIVFELDDTWVRPLDGTCGADSANAGDLCLNDTDCEAGSGPGSCEGSAASEVIGNDGIGLVIAGDTVLGNLLGGPCTPTTAGGASCAFPFFPAVPCTMDSQCDLTISGNFCRPTFYNQVNSVEFTAPPASILSTELYEISKLNIRQVALYRDNPVFLGRCGNTTEVALALGDALRFTVPQGTDKVIRLTLHLDVLEQVLTTLNSCAPFQAVLEQAITCDTCDAGI
jgi:hypothetical protein